MSRDDGFDVADTDTAMLSDPKVLRLARLLKDPIRTAAAMTLYDAVRLASWKAGRRVELDDAVPGWWLEPYDDLAQSLIRAGLLDDEQRIPEHAWEGWFGPARDRREEFRAMARRGGRASADKRTLDRTVDPVEPTVDRTVNTVRPSVRPSVPTDPAVPPANGRAHDDDEMDPALAAYVAAGGSPSRSSLQFLDELIAEYGQEATARAIGTASMRNPNRGKLLGETKAVLAVDARNAERSEAAAEKRRNAEKRMPVYLAPLPDNTPPERVAEEVAAYLAAKEGRA